MSDLLLLVTVFGVTFVAELPDKSLFASLVLGTRYRPAQVWLGVAAAFAVHVGLAVTVGGLLALAPHWVVDFVSAALFLGGAAWMVWTGHEEERIAPPGGLVGCPYLWAAVRAQARCVLRRTALPCRYSAVSASMPVVAGPSRTYRWVPLARAAWPWEPGRALRRDRLLARPVISYRHLATMRWHDLPALRLHAWPCL